MTVVEDILKELDRLGNVETALNLKRFFKTGPGEYGDGDKFRGICVPVLRNLAKQYGNINISDAESLLKSPFHEDRLLALLILVQLYSRGDYSTKNKIYALYLENTKLINNWDLVDASAEHIVGNFLMDKGKEPLTRLAQSSNMWERRIAIMSTFHYIKRGKFNETFRIAKILLHDIEDLIHKAVGWMLREVGKRDIQAEEKFLVTYYTQMPRTMLRYAIEKFPESRREAYLKGRI